MNARFKTCPCWCASFLLALLTLPGCLSEHSFPMIPERLIHLATSQVDSHGQRLDTRNWVTQAHTAASIRLQSDDRLALTSDGLTTAGQITDVWKKMDIDPHSVDSLLGNWRGIEQTAQVTSPPPIIEKGHVQRPPWTGFTEVWVPGGTSSGKNPVLLYGRLGIPDKAHEIPGSYIIITTGLFGSLDGFDMENHVQALRHAGHHVLALEMRGHGETQCSHPEYVISFGIYESGDLIAAARWLKQTQHATRVGLVSFSLTGYEALLTAWLDGNTPITEFDGEKMLANLPRPLPEPAFNAGMFVVSAPVGMIGLADRFDPRVTLLEAPCKATFQEHVASRLASYKEPAAYSMWALAKSEFRRSEFDAISGSFERAREILVSFLDMRRGQWSIGTARMERVRVPLLVLSSANDPLGTAQDVAELFGRVRNPNVGVILLREGGHMGFSALSADYYYSVMLNFFDPRTAPRTVDPGIPTAAK